MARIYARKRGKAGSKRPMRKGYPRWVKYKKGEVEKLIAKYAKEDKSSSEIGMILRDQYGVPLTKSITNKGISVIMKENQLYPKFPEDLFNLFKRAINLRNHLANSKKDYTSKRGLELLESKIRRLGKYYVSRKVLPEDWKYDPEKVKLLIQQK